MEDHFLTTLKMHCEWDGKGKYKSKFPSTMWFGLKSMTVGKGNRLAAILYNCQNQMGKGIWLSLYFGLGNGIWT